MQAANAINGVYFLIQLPHAMKLHARSNQNAVSPTIASPSNLVAVGRKFDRIHDYEANLLEEDNRQ
jgi:hypothetical protein